MKILVDENIPRITVRALRDLGHDVLDLRGTARQGFADQAVWELAQTEARILVTTDKGFVEHREEEHHGLLVVRLRQPNRQRIHERVLYAIGHQQGDWAGFVVVLRDQVQSVWSRSSE
jgi:predicted nuclease of predicted toxin-antitoxin system